MKSVTRITRFSRLVIALILSNSTAFADLDSALVKLHYDLEIASYCGLVTPKVMEGFHIALNQNISENNLSREDIEQARMQAWKDAHEEWANRGLGGFKSWCQNEVTEAANGLRSFAN